MTNDCKCRFCGYVFPTAKECEDHVPYCPENE